MENLKVLIDIRTLVDEKEEPENICEKIYDEAEYEASEYLAGRIELIKSVHDCDYKNLVTFGQKEPEKIREIVESWNSRILCDLEDSLSKFEICAGQEGLDGIFGVIEAGKGGKEFKNFYFENEIYKLRKAFNAVDNSFQYGHDRVAITGPSSYGSDCFLYLPEHIEKDATEHPEKYAIVNLLYD